MSKTKIAIVIKTLPAFGAVGSSKGGSQLGLRVIRG